MAIPNPWSEPENGSESGKNEDHCARERERDHAGAREYTVDQGSATEDTADNLVFLPRRTTDGTDGDGAPTAELEVRPAPGALAKFGDVSKAWGSDAWETAKRGLDKTVWTERPASLRDMYVRIQRAEWAGDVKVLRTVGTCLGYLCLVLTAIGRGALWPLARPARLLITTAIVVLIAVLAI
ncbi:hypothetical protein [Saccharopolyspora sp. NPDC002376]